MTDMDEFRQYLEKIRSEHFFAYQEASSLKRSEFISFTEEQGIKLKSIRFLDVGPGYGDALDVSYEMGAKCVDFVEVEPLFYTYNRLKPFAKGYRLNHMISLGHLERGRYDFIWVKGSVSADFFIMSKLNVQNFWLLHWLDRIERLVSPTSHIVICPHWANHSQRRVIEDTRHNLFTDTMLHKGYRILPAVKNHNHEPEYPITFYKSSARKA